MLAASAATTSPVITVGHTLSGFLGPFASIRTSTRVRPCSLFLPVTRVVPSRAPGVIHTGDGVRRSPEDRKGAVVTERGSRIGIKRVKGESAATADEFLWTASGLAAYAGAMPISINGAEDLAPPPNCASSTRTSQRFAEFAKRYRSELHGRAASAAVAELIDLSRRKRLTLLTASRDLEHSDTAILARQLSGVRRSSTSITSRGDRSTRYTSHFVVQMQPQAAVGTTRIVGFELIEPSTRPLVRSARPSARPRCIEQTVSGSARRGGHERTRLEHGASTRSPRAQGDGIENLALHRFDEEAETIDVSRRTESFTTASTTTDVDG